MPVTPSLSFKSVGGAAPATVALAPGQEIQVESVSATFNGAAASGTFLACLAVYSQSGVLIGRWFPSTRMAVGDSGEVTYSPFSGGGDSDSTVRLQILCVDSSTTLTVGDGAGYFGISDDMNGLTLVDADAEVLTVSSSGTPTFQLRNARAAVDMLSTKITIDANEFSSYTAATPPVINAANAGVLTADRIYVDIDVAGTGAQGLIVYVAFA